MILEVTNQQNYFINGVREPWSNLVSPNLDLKNHGTPNRDQKTAVHQTVVSKKPRYTKPGYTNDFQKKPRYMYPGLLIYRGISSTLIHNDIFRIFFAKIL